MSTKNDLDRLITLSIVNTVGFIFGFLHVSERWSYRDNTYDDITRPISSSPELGSSPVLASHRKTYSEINEHLHALEQLTNALCKKATQWEHIILVLPIEACRTFRGIFLGRTGMLHFPRLTTFCFTIAPPIPVPDVNAQYSSTSDDFSLVRDVLSVVLNAPETKNVLKNLFFDFTPSHEMLERHPTADISGASSALGDDTPLKASVLPYPLSDLSKHSLRYIQVTSPCPPINVFHLLDLSKGSLEHLVVPISYGPLVLDENEQRDDLILPMLTILQTTLLQSTREGDPAMALSLLKFTVFPELKRFMITWPAPLFRRSNVDTIGASEIQRQLENAVGSAILECAIQIRHHSEFVVNGLRESLLGWSQIDVEQLTV